MDGCFCTIIVFIAQILDAHRPWAAVSVQSLCLLLRFWNLIGHERLFLYNHGVYCSDSGCSSAMGSCFCTIIVFIAHILDAHRPWATVSVQSLCLLLRFWILIGHGRLFLTIIVFIAQILDAHRPWAAVSVQSLCLLLIFWMLIGHGRLFLYNHCVYCSDSGSSSAMGGCFCTIIVCIAQILDPHRPWAAVSVQSLCLLLRFWMLIGHGQLFLYNHCVYCSYSGCSSAMGGCFCTIIVFIVQILDAHRPWAAVSVQSLCLLLRFWMLIGHGRLFLYNHCVYCSDSGCSSAMGGCFCSIIVCIAQILDAHRPWAAVSVQSLCLLLRFWILIDEYRNVNPVPTQRCILTYTFLQSRSIGDTNFILRPYYYTLSCMHVYKDLYN